MAPTLLGIDPGNNGGIVQFENYDKVGWSLEHCCKLERGEEHIVSFIKQATDNGTFECVAYLEKVHGWGVARSFNFGRYYGYVRGVLRAFNVEIVDVQPQTWMKHAGVTGKSQTKEKRESMRQLAEQRLENTGQVLGVTNWNAAAVLIGYYGIYQQGLREQ